MVIIKGRNRYSESALTEIVISDRYGRDYLTIEGGYLENRGEGEFMILAKHPTATDEEGDSSYVAYISGAGLVWTGMMGGTHTFTGAIVSVKYMPDDIAQGFIDENDYLPFTPPPQSWKPGSYQIRVKHLTNGDEDE